MMEMNSTLNILESWLRKTPRVKGVLACGIHMADRRTINRSFRDGFPEASLDNAWRCVADALQTLNSQRCPALRLRWVFENCWLFCIVRRDGSFLGVFTNNQQTEIDDSMLSRMLHEFASIPVLAVE